MKKSGLYACDNCGAELHFKNGENIKECSYCGNIIALLANEYKNVEISKMIPFEIDAAGAKMLLKKYKGSLLSVEVDKLEKVYVPFYYCSFDFGFLFNYDDGQNYRHCIFVDGKIKNSFFPAVKIHNRDSFYGLDFVKYDRVTNYDPLKAGDYKLLPGNIIDPVKVIENVARDYSVYNITHGTEKISISSSECAEFNEKIELVLVPFYVYNGVSSKHYILAQNITQKVEQFNSARRNKDIFSFFALVLFVVSMVLAIFLKEYEISFFVGTLCISLFLGYLYEKKIMNDMDLRKSSCEVKRIR